MNSVLESPDELTPRGRELVTEHHNEIYIRNGRLFAILMPLQWLAAIASAMWFSPRLWMGAVSHIHMHVWAAVFLGASIASLPVYLALTRPCEVFTRHV